MQLADLSPATLQRHLDQLATRYALRNPDVRIADTPSNRRDLLAAGLDPNAYIGQMLRGQQILEVPVQKTPPPLDFLLDADSRPVLVRDIEGTTWSVSDDGTSVVEKRGNGTSFIHPSVVGAR